jgi:hypothetical protein
MGVLIDEAQVAMLEAMMAERGFLTGRPDGRQLPVPALARAGVVGNAARAVAGRARARTT